MTGGLLQLVSVGQIDQYLISNPQISFYHHVYKRHTQFSMESRKLYFKISNSKFTPETNILECDIPRYGDLLKDIYFCFTLPDVYSSDKYRFKWVKNIGNIAVKKASVHIDGVEIDKITGDWLNIWNELTTIDNKYDVLIGNVEELNNPRLSEDRIVIENNKFTYYFYPESSMNENKPPSIKSREIIVPLNFWFTKNPALALPLLRLQLNAITIKVEIESSENLYQVYSDKIIQYVNPIYYNELHDDSINIFSFVKSTATINQHIEANYIYLGNTERNNICVKPTMRYLVEQLSITSMTSIKNKNASNYKLKLNNNIPIKELVWVFRRDDYFKFNDFNNYSPTIPETKADILDKASIRFSNRERIQEKPAQYFNMIQPYQHHTNIPKNGIYCYSFAHYPEKQILSGYYNSALISTELDFYVSTDYNNDIINAMLIQNNKSPYDFDYSIFVYGLGYNLFEIVGSQVGMKFVS